MSNKVTDSREFVRGAARSRDVVYILSRGKGLMSQDIAHTSAIGIQQGRWGDAANASWDSTAIAVAKHPSERLVFVGEDGDVCTYVGGQSTKESISPPPKLIRNATTVEGYVLVCGMLRQVYRRVSEGRWSDLSAPDPKPGEEVGFEAICGYSEKEIYAVGWNGEIWEYDGSTWHDRSGLTNVILTAACCAPDDVTYVAGQQGVVIRGRHDSWEVIEREDDIDVDFWDLCWFNGKLFVAAINNLYILEGNRLVEVDFADFETPTCYSLTASQGVLWSIGRDDVLSFDGDAWQSYE